MRELVAWTFKAVILPLLPIWAGALIRYLCLGVVSWELLGVAELSFSMGMLYLLISTSAGQMTDQHLRSLLTTTCYWITATFFVLFVLSTAFEVLDVSHNRHVVEEISATLDASSAPGPSLLQSLNDPTRHLFGPILSRIRACVLWFLVPGLVVPFVLRYKYKLEA